MVVEIVDVFDEPNTNPLERRRATKTNDDDDDDDGALDDDEDSGVECRWT